jgi:DNA helicase-2/ATP-dependent DNA helicase PcrA
MSASSLLLALDPEQHTAVTAPADAVIVLAGAGSGKTTVLTQRIIQRIENATADAEHTLAITFTREAAGQLRRRTPRGVHTGTFHAIAFALIRQRLTDQGKSIPAVLTNKFGVMNEAVRGIRSRVAVAEALGELEWMQARALTPITYPKAATEAKRFSNSKPEELVSVFSEYEKLKRKKGVVDLGDLLVRATDDIVSQREHADVVHWRYRHILVDEAQDMNPQQFAFFQALRGDRRDVFVVGDPLQAIYGWNGSDPSLFDSLPDSLGGATVVRLVNNYRCSPAIVAAGIHVLTSNGIPASARAVRHDSEKITISAHYDEADEAKAIVDHAMDAHRSLQRWSDIAVLVRTNAQRDLVVDALKGLDIPVATGGTSALIAPLLQEVSALTNRYALADWALELRMATEANSPEMLVVDLVDDFLRDHPFGAANGSMFMSWYNTSASRPSPDDGVDILTFHAAKGREWHTVIIGGAEKGLLPHSSARSAAQKAEETRLAYVAVTRAAEKLYITSAGSRNGRTSHPSPFFTQLPLGETTAVRMPKELRTVASGAAPTSPIAALTAWRKERARILRTSERSICSDAVLRSLSDTLPQTREALADVVGPMTADSLATSLLPVLAGFAPTNPQ